MLADLYKTDASAQYVKSMCVEIEERLALADINRLQVSARSWFKEYAHQAERVLVDFTCSHVENFCSENFPVPLYKYFEVEDLSVLGNPIRFGEIDVLPVFEYVLCDGILSYVCSTGLCELSLNLFFGIFRASSLKTVYAVSKLTTFLSENEEYIPQVVQVILEDSYIELDNFQSRRYSVADLELLSKNEASYPLKSLWDPPPDFLPHNYNSIPFWVLSLIDLPTWLKKIELIPLFEIQRSIYYGYLRISQEEDLYRLVDLTASCVATVENHTNCAMLLYRIPTELIHRILWHRTINPDFSLRFENWIARFIEKLAAREDFSLLGFQYLCSVCKERRRVREDAENYFNLLIKTLSDALVQYAGANSEIWGESMALFGSVNGLTALVLAQGGGNFSEIFQRTFDVERCDYDELDYYVLRVMSTAISGDKNEIVSWLNLWEHELTNLRFKSRYSAIHRSIVWYMSISCYVFLCLVRQNSEYSQKCFDIILGSFHEMVMLGHWIDLKFACSYLNAVVCEIKNMKGYKFDVFPFDDVLEFANVAQTDFF